MSSKERLRCGRYLQLLDQLRYSQTLVPNWLTNEVISPSLKRTIQSDFSHILQELFRHILDYCLTFFESLPKNDVFFLDFLSFFLIFTFLFEVQLTLNLPVLHEPLLNIPFYSFFPYSLYNKFIMFCYFFQENKRILDDKIYLYQCRTK